MLLVRQQLLQGVLLRLLFPLADPATLNRLCAFVLANGAVRLMVNAPLEKFDEAHRRRHQSVLTVNESRSDQTRDLSPPVLESFTPLHRQIVEKLGAVNFP